MSDNKTTPDNQTSSVLEGQQKTAWERTRLKEACQIVIYLLESKRYDWQDAFHVIEELSPNWERCEVEEIIKDGVTEKVLKEAEDALSAKGAVKNIVR